MNGENTHNSWREESRCHNPGSQAGRKENRRKETEEEPNVRHRWWKKSQHWGQSFVGTQSGKRGTSGVREENVSRREWPTEHRQEKSREIDDDWKVPFDLTPLRI